MIIIIIIIISCCLDKAVIRHLGDVFWPIGLINSIISSIFGLRFLHFKDQVKEGQILDLYKDFINKNFQMNFKISRFVEFTDL